MLRLRFHGRGGQGMKTASRIVGSAAFQAGWVVQDSPIYGAERRGAPIVAFTRMAHESILERGAIISPDLVVVADDTLLTEPAAQPLAGCDSRCTLLLNTEQEVSTIQTLTAHAGRILTTDFTAPTLQMAQSLGGLSTALGVAAACLVGLGRDDTLAGLDAELHSVHITPAQADANRALAEAIYTTAQAWEPILESEEEAPYVASQLAHVAFVPPAQAAPSIYAMGNSPARHTGSWRQFRPVLHAEKCTRCWLCFVWCPEAAISLAADDYPVVDYDVCKGCLLCAHECPTHAFTIEQEAHSCTVRC